MVDPESADRNLSGLVTTGQIRGGDVASLGGEIASSSLFSLQQVLQRNDTKAIGAALSSLAARVQRRDIAALRVLDDWIASSPRLAELFHAHRLTTPGEMSGDRDVKLLGVLRTFSYLIPRVKNDEHARDVWHQVAREWASSFLRCFRGGRVNQTFIGHAALEALEAAVLRVGAPAARVVASWMAGDADGASLWAALCSSTTRTKHTGRAGGVTKMRQKCVLLATAMFAAGDRDTKLALLDETRGVIPLLFSTLADSGNAQAARLLSALAIHGLRAATTKVNYDASLRRACLRVCASDKGVTSLRALAATSESRKDAVALFELLALDERWLHAAQDSFAAAKDEHVRILRALDPCGDPNQLDLLLAAMKAAPMLLVPWLATASRSALSSPRPWDFKADDSNRGCPSERSLAGCAAFRAVLRGPAKATRVLQSVPFDDLTQAAIIDACLPPEGVLSKKELTRGVLHANEQAQTAALELLLDLLDRYYAEVDDIFDKDTWEDSEDVTDQLAAALERSLAPEGNTKEDRRLVRRLLPSVNTETKLHLKDVKFFTREQLQSRLPDIKTLLNVVNSANSSHNIVSLALAAVRRYCLTVPRVVADVKWDIFKAMANAAASANADDDFARSNAHMLIGQLAGIVRVHPVDQMQRLRRPEATDKSASRIRSKLFAMLNDSPPIRALIEDVLTPVTNSSRERRIWLDALSSSPDTAIGEGFFRILGHADQLKSLPPAVFNISIGLARFEDAVRNSEYFLEHWDSEDEGAGSTTTEEPGSGRAGLISPLVCAVLLHKNDEEPWPLVTKIVVELLHVVGAHDQRCLRSLCLAVIALKPANASLCSFCRAMERDLRDVTADDKDAKANVDIRPESNVRTEVRVKEGCASEEKLLHALKEKVGMPLLTPKSQRSSVYRALEQTPDAFPTLREVLLELSFPLLIAHLCAPFSNDKSCVAGTSWGTVALQRAVQIVISKASKETCIDACFAAAVGLARCSKREHGNAQQLLRDTQHDLVAFVLSRQPRVASCLDAGLFYDKDDSRTPLLILWNVRATSQSTEGIFRAAPRAMSVAEGAALAIADGLPSPCLELAAYVTPAASRSAVKVAAAQGRLAAVATILKHASKPTVDDIGLYEPHTLFNLWWHCPEAPAIVDRAVTPRIRTSIIPLLRKYMEDESEWHYEACSSLIEACWHVARALDAPLSRQFAAQRCAAALISLDTNSRAKLRRIIARAKSHEDKKQIASCFYFAICRLQSHTAYVRIVCELAHFDSLSASEPTLWRSVLAEYAVIEVELAVAGRLPPPGDDSYILRLCDCANLLLLPSACKSLVADVSHRLSSVKGDVSKMRSWNTEKSKTLADVSRAALSWLEHAGLREAKPRNTIFEFLSVHQPGCLRNLVPSVLKVDHIYLLAANFHSHESGRVLLHAVRHASANVNTELLLNSITGSVRKFPGIALRILDALECNTQDALEAALAVYTGSLSSADRTALRILTRCGLPRDAPGVRAWATAISGNAADANHYREGEWIFDFLNPDRIAASVVRFPLRRAVRTGNDEMEDDDPILDIPEDEDTSDDTEMEEEDEEDEESVPEDSDGEWDRGFQAEGDDGDEEHSRASSDATDTADEEDDCGACDDYEAEDGMSDAEDDEDCEAAWRAKCYDPRFVLPALYHALAESDYEDDEARIARRAYESGGIAYAAAALSSKHSQTRALAVAVLGRFSAKLASGASSMDRGFVARPFVRTILQATFAALKEASDPLRGPRRLPCLWSSVIARCFDALTSPRHAGFAVAAAHTVRRAIARPWYDAPLVRDAFINDSGLAFFCDDDARDKVRGRFWAYECLVDGTRDNSDAKSLTRAGGLSLAMNRMEELLSGGASIVASGPNETRIMLMASGMAPPGAGSLLEQRNGKEDLVTLRKVNALARAEGDAAHRLLASVGRSRYGRRLLVTDGPVYYLADRIAATHEARDIELTGAIMSAACDDLDYFSEDRFPFLIGFFDLATDAVMSSFYDLLAETAKDSKSNRILTNVLSSLEDEDFEDEFLAKPLSIIGDFGELRGKSGPDLHDTVSAALNFFVRRYLVTRQLTLNGVKRIGGYNDRHVHVEDAWSISKAVILVCFGEQLDLRTAAARLMRTVCSDASAARLAMTFGPAMVVFFGQQLWIGLKEKDPIGNRLFGPLLEFFAAILISRLTLQRTYHSNEGSKLPCPVSTRRQVAATIDLSLKAARIGQGRPAVDMLAAARLEFGLGFGHAASEPFVPTPICPLHRVDDLRLRLSQLAQHDRRGVRPGMAVSCDTLLADALDAAAQKSHSVVPQGAAGFLTADDMLNAPNPQPGDSTHETALMRIEAYCRGICEHVTMTDLDSVFISILLNHIRPQVDPKDLIVDVKVCDVCLGKVLPKDLEYLDKTKQLWWRVDISPES